ncbi:MAG TPA: SDR family NAD(P)-dependent oxidoreductase [Nocardioidaceae bacterium]|nr:SDR family NAD(P)-dependent oxidoreductase [Nocardioidaceae bacterium]
MTVADTKPLAVVTGASSGIGLELAKQFADNGYDLIIAAEDDALDGAVSTIGNLGAAVKVARVDLATYDGVERLWSTIESNGRAVDAIAINAGVGAGGDFTRDVALDDELALIQLNVVSTVHLAKRVLPGMVERGNGRVLFTSSIAAMMPSPFQAVYGASKSFVQSLAEGLRVELEGTGVTVTALMPGPTETDFFRRADMEDTKIGSESKDDAAQVARQGYDALMSGKEKVIAGSVKTRAMGESAKVTPDHAKAKMHRSIAEPGSADS